MAIAGLEVAVDLPASRREVGLARPRGLQADTDSCGGPANCSWITSVEYFDTTMAHGNFFILAARGCVVVDTQTALLRLTSSPAPGLVQSPGNPASSAT